MTSAWIEDGDRCVIVAYRGGGHRVFGPFPSFGAAREWCRENKTNKWFTPCICMAVIPDMEDPVAVNR